MVARGRRRLAGGRGAIVRADATRLPFPDASFDVVVASAVLGLLPGPARRMALHELVRVTRGEVRLLEPFHRPGTRPHELLARVVALARPPLLELCELSDVGLEPSLGDRVLFGVYSVVRATARPRA
jgi:ubiquinone/menaquinone biosynthesis C-methylase UbiE